MLTHPARSHPFAAAAQIFLSLVCACSFTGCATTWSASEKAQLSAVSVSTPILAKEAYHKPDATESPGMANGIPAATGGGLIPALIGSAIDASVTSKQQRKYEADNAQYFEGLAKAMNTPPLALIESALKQKLAAHPFFGSRMVDKSDNTFVVEVLKYGLQKPPGHKGDKVPLRVRIVAKITLKLPNGSSLWEHLITGVSLNAKTAEEILAEPKFVPAGIDEAVTDFCAQVSHRLDEKLVEKK